LEPGHYWFQFDDNEDANYEASVLVGLSGGPAFSRRKFDLIQFSHEPLALRIFGVEGPCLLVISVDVKPDDPSNSINPFSRGVVPIALLGSESFDVADVDTDTLRFGPGQGEIAHRSGPHLVDIDGDGLMDLLGHFRTEESGLSTEETAACVTGETRDGTPFEGCDAVQIVPLF
jgi:hypothetical protein